MGTSKYAVSDRFWDVFAQVLPVRVNTHRFGGGRPRRSDRDCLNGILFVLRTGCQWNALSATGICPSSTAHDRFQDWVESGVFARLFDLALKDYDELIGIDWSFLSMDGAMTKAPLGGEATGANPTDRGKKRDQTKPAGRRSRDSAVGGGRRREHA